MTLTDRIREALHGISPQPWSWNSYSHVASGPLIFAEDDYLESLPESCEGEQRCASCDPDGKHHYCPRWAETYDKDASVCFVPASHGDTATGRHATDARFIAAAPSLLAEALTEIDALKEALREIDRAERQLRYGVAPIRLLIDEVLAALDTEGEKKADG